jgi:hypothetical protein
MPDTSEKFMLVGGILDLVLDNIEVVPANEREDGMRRAHFFHSNISQLAIIEMIEEVYGD